MLNDLTDYLSNNAIMVDLFRRAYVIAEQSPDPSTRNGALLVHGTRFGNQFLGTPEIVAEGFNVILPGGLDKPENYLDRTKKYPWISHAEARVLGLAAQTGIPTLGLDLVCPWACCLDCAVTAVEHGIRRIIGHAEAFEKSNEGSGDRLRWADEISKAREYLAGSKTEYVLWKGKIGGVRNLFAGQYWEP